jgi:hypothetical protein
MRNLLVILFFILLPHVHQAQVCKPQFPHKDGWLGGDGEVSVALNDSITLFFFSDSYVGPRPNSSRKSSGIKMISNAVAVTTCSSQGKTIVQYYWKNMYTQKTEPIFKPRTDDYRFWIPNAFLARDQVYVILAQIGTKKDAKPGELFNFTLLGHTLARIANPFDTPDQWQIKYYKLPGLDLPDLTIQSHVLKDGFVYFFLNRDNKEQFLIRKSIDLITKPKKTFEYFARDNSWKKGLNRKDMKIVIAGFRSNTVNFHADLKKWIMICDVRFKDNKIFMRTAPELTGPWSDEIPIYEIPETTPGKPEYSKNNFCYLPRECIQFYDAKKRELLLTYDINNSSIPEIIANPKIYTPKVITISLRNLDF